MGRFSENDLLDPFDYLSDPEAVKFEPCRPMTLEEVREELNRRIASDETSAVELKPSGKLINKVYPGKRENNALEIGFLFNKSYWNQGYAAVSCKATVHEAISSGVARIYTECDPEKQSSWNLLERLSFTRTAHLEKKVFFRKDNHG